MEVDLRRPESSAWLRSLLEEVQSNDPEARSFALFRLKAGLIRIVMTKGHALGAGLAAYVLEQGVLDEINKLMKAAQSEGDFYIFPKISSQDKVKFIKYFVLSKVDICFRLLHVLILDARTARFVMKGIPDLISVLEGAYFALSAVSLVRESDLVPGCPAYLERLRDEVKASSLSVLMSLASSSDRFKDNISSRKVLLHQVLQDCMAERDFSNRTVDCTLYCFNHLSSACDLSEYLDDIVGVVLKTLAETQTAVLIPVAAHLLTSIMQKGQAKAVVGRLFELGASGKAEHLVPAVLALAACPDLEETTKRIVRILLAALNKRFGITVEERLTDPLKPKQQETLERLVRACPEAMARREQLCEIFTAKTAEKSAPDSKSPASLFRNTIETPLSYVPDKAFVSFVPDGDLKAQRRPRRKCSRLSCSNVETTSCEFKVCSGCRLAVYCSRGRGSCSFLIAHRDI